MKEISKCVCLALLACCSLATGQQQQNLASVEQAQPSNFPYYMQSPIAPQLEPAYVQQQQNDQQKPLTQRASIPRMAAGGQAQPVPPIQAQTQQQPLQPTDMAQGQPNLNLEQQQQSQQCLYDKGYFARFDECLARRPYPTIGLPAFKNEDLLVKQGRNKLKIDAKRGCSFILSNGLFKNYLISGFSLDTDTQCLDTNGKVAISLEFSNATLYYLWQLRCLNYADQLLDDSSSNGKLSESLEADLQQAAGENGKRPMHLCAGSSQTFGFTSLQLSNIEAQIEMVTDVYKNWRVTNVTLAFASRPGQHDSLNEPASSIRDFTFESLDGDELNWRHLQMFSNWSRNRLHTNFLEQFRRFIWISLQRCLSEHSEKLPIKLVDVFGNHRHS